MPNMSEQYILSGVSVRLISDGERERERHDAFLDDQHYLKSGQLVGEQLRYVAECDGFDGCTSYPDLVSQRNRPGLWRGLSDDRQSEPEGIIREPARHTHRS